LSPTATEASVPRTGTGRPGQVQLCSEGVDGRTTGLRRKKPKRASRRTERLSQCLCTHRQQTTRRASRGPDLSMSWPWSSPQ